MWLLIENGNPHFFKGNFADFSNADNSLKLFYFFSFFFFSVFFFPPKHCVGQGKYIVQLDLAHGPLALSLAQHVSCSPLRQARPQPWSITAYQQGLEITPLCVPALKPMNPLMGNKCLSQPPPTPTPTTVEGQELLILTHHIQVIGKGEGGGVKKSFFFFLIKQKKGKRKTYKEQLEQARLLMRATTIAGQRGKQLSSAPIPDRKIIEQRPDKPRPSLCHSRAECNYIPSPTANKKGNVSSGRLRSPKELTSGKDAAGRASSRRPAGIPRLSIPSTNGMPRVHRQRRHSPVTAPLIRPSAMQGDPRGQKKERKYWPCLRLLSPTLNFVQTLLLLVVSSC